MDLSCRRNFGVGGADGTVICTRPGGFEGKWICPMYLTGGGSGGRWICPGYIVWGGERDLPCLPNMGKERGRFALST